MNACDHPAPRCYAGRRVRKEAHQGGGGGGQLVGLLVGSPDGSQGGNLCKNASQAGIEMAGGLGDTRELLQILNASHQLVTPAQ